MNENVWSQDAQRRHDRIVTAVREVSAAERGGRPADPIGPGPLMGALVLAIAVGMSPIAIGAGIAGVVLLREAIRRLRRRIARPAGRMRRAVPAWS